MDFLAVSAVLGFAAYRVTQLIVWDSILDGWRKRVEAWHMNGVRPGSSNRVRTFFKQLLSCTYCVGFHAAWLTVLVYLLATGRAPWDSWGSFWLFGIQSFAVSGVQALLNRWDDTQPGHQPND